MVNGYAGYMIWRVPRITIEKQPWKGVLIQPNVQQSEALGKKGDPLGGGLKAWMNMDLDAPFCHSERSEESREEEKGDSSLRSEWQING